MKEVQAHATEADCWTVVGGGVYDVTKYLDKHPGGKKLLARNAGKDSTQDFEALFHSSNARRILETYRVGTLEGSTPKGLAMPNMKSGGYPNRMGRPQGRAAVVKKKYKLGAKKTVSQDVALFRFVPRDKKGSPLEVPVGCHVKLCLTVGGARGERIRRAYTPVNATEEHIDLVVRMYKGGKLTPALFSLQENAEVEIAGPFRTLDHNITHFKAVLLVCGGTGMAPIYQLAKSLAKRAKRSLDSKKDAVLPHTEIIVAASQGSPVLLEKEITALLSSSNNAVDTEKHQSPVRSIRVFHSPPASATSSSPPTATSVVPKRLRAQDVRESVERLRDQYAKGAEKGKAVLVVCCGPPGFSEAMEKGIPKGNSSGVTFVALRANPAGRRGSGSKEGANASPSKVPGALNLSVTAPKGGVPDSKEDGKKSGTAAAPVRGGAFLVAAPKRKKRGKKVPLAPGHSQLDWMRKTQTMKPPQVRRLAKEEIALHNKKDDLWMVIQGRVYDVTPYAPFHPGGVPELMAGAGKDASNLFTAAHPWVNVHRLLERCCVGVLAE